MKIKTGFELRTICGYHMIIAFGEENVDFSLIVQLNESAAFLWQKMLGTVFDSSMMAEALTEEYDVDKDTALRDSETIALQWKEAGLVED